MAFLIFVLFWDAQLSISNYEGTFWAEGKEEKARKEEHIWNQFSSRDTRIWENLSIVVVKVGCQSVIAKSALFLILFLNIQKEEGEALERGVKEANKPSISLSLSLLLTPPLRRKRKKERREERERREKPTELTKTKNHKTTTTTTTTTTRPSRERRGEASRV